jgi:hypothetical protein
MFIRSQKSPIDSIGTHGTHPADSGMAESIQRNQPGDLADSTFRYFKISKSPPPQELRRGKPAFGLGKRVSSESPPFSQGIRGG